MSALPGVSEGERGYLIIRLSMGGSMRPNRSAVSDVSVADASLYFVVALGLLSTGEGVGWDGRIPRGDARAWCADCPWCGRRRIRCSEMGGMTEMAAG